MRVGQRVRWRSQANGSWSEKTGTVVAVVEPGQDVYSLGLDFHKYTIGVYGLPRRQRSYLVAAPDKRETWKPRLYWPFANTLKED